ncbi:MAG: cache domain-containing protein [Gammaproteobacteria bacterium]|nr:cache domain-containing protein [Gammaproteobacteria bacterium]
MSKKLLTGFAAFCVMGLSSSVWATDFGTADEAKMMLEKAVAAVQADEAKALAAFNKGEGGFKEKDLYVFCGGADGNFTAHGAKAELVGKSLKGLKDKAGKALGEEIYKEAHEGAFVEVTYMWPRPGEEKPSEKVVYAEKVGDQICAVGYYKP